MMLFIFLSQALLVPSFMMTMDKQKASAAYGPHATNCSIIRATEFGSCFGCSGQIQYLLHSSLQERLAGTTSAAILQGSASNW